MIRRLVLVAAVLLASCSDDKGDDVRLSADESTTSTSEETTTTSEATTTTTAAPVVTTVKAPTTTAKPTTTTSTIPASMAKVTVVNNYPASMVVNVNGVKVTVAANSRKGPFGVKPGATDGNDVITLARSDDPTCGTGGADGYFAAGGTYEVTVIVSAPSGCNNGKPSPGGRVNPGNKGV
ncbi:MAG TPA: hypothetical protein VM938_15765 [Acidimicrobiales bacterium]|nr:hypothetical protein [Acidimicrobiales bacterium]